MAVQKKKKPHYVNNKEFLQAMVEWKAKCREAEKAGKPQPPITNYIGECFKDCEPPFVSSKLHQLHI